jgi:N-acetylglucosaminyl-diphospho-decaprenol L-rhamnosyltransferase
MTTTDVSVVIVSWNVRESLLACLRSLSAHPPSGSWEAIVIDNASADGTVDAVRREAPWARVIVNATNRGLAAANNQGLREAGGRVIVVSNPDVEYRAGAIDALVDLLGRRPRAAFAFARLLDPDGTVLTCAGDPPTLLGALRGRQAVRPLRDGETPSGYWWDGWAHDREVQIGHGLEACYAIRRDALEEIGLQDEGFWLDWEGVDWVTRARESGWQVWFCPSAEVVHLGGSSVRQVPLRWIVHSHRGIYRFFAKRSPVIVRPLLALIVLARAVVKLLVQAARVDLYGRAYRAGRSRRDAPR